MSIVFHVLELGTLRVFSSTRILIWVVRIPDTSFKLKVLCNRNAPNVMAQRPFTQDKKDEHH